MMLIRPENAAERFTMSAPDQTQVKPMTIPIFPLFMSSFISSLWHVSIVSLPIDHVKGSNVDFHKPEFLH